MVLNKDEVLDVLQLSTEEVPFGKGVVIVSEIAAVDWDELISSPDYRVDGVINEKKLQPALIACAVLNADGSRMFTDEEAGKLAQSGKKAFRTLIAAIMRLNGLGDETVKNSKETVTGDSTSDSVSTSATYTLPTS